MEDPSWYHRRVLRSLKKVFQSRCSAIVWAVVDSGEEDDEGEAVEEADLVVIEGVLNNTLRFTRGTRRRGGEEESEDRRGVEELVW
jgi:hypothetical protein